MSQGLCEAKLSQNKHIVNTKELYFAIYRIFFYLCFGSAPTLLLFTALNKSR